MREHITREPFDAALQELRIVDRTTHDGIASLREDMARQLDGLAVMLQRLDQEWIFTIEWVRRIESDLGQVKNQLHIAS